ncbi:MAG TPA: DUF935 domain-containing protein [Thermodesulfobacteriota bacterium]
MPTLYDAYGRPVDLGALRREQAAPSLTGIRTIWAGHPAKGLTPERLARLLREAEDGDPMRYLELAEDMEERDLHYLAVLGTRKRAVAQLELTVEAASDAAADVEAADLVREWLRRDDLEAELVDILDAIGKGFSATEIIWELSASRWWPVRLEHRDPRWFEFDRIDGRTLLLREAGLPVPLAPFKFIVHRHTAKTGLPIRGGLARAAAWAYLFKNYGVKDWVTFVEVYGQPLRVGKYGPGATDEDKEKLFQALRNLGSDAAAMIPQEMMIEFIDAKRGSSTASGAEVFKQLADFMDQQVSKAVLGQTTTTDAISGGHAVAKEHNEVRRDIQRADAKQLAATLNRDLVRPLVDLNLGPQKAYPRIIIGLRDATNVAELSDALAKLVPLGLKVEQSVVRDKLGLPDPPAGKDVELLAQPAPPAPPVAPPADPEGPPARASRLARQAAANAAREGDAIDALIDAELADWQPLLGPLVGELREVLAGASSLEEIRERLADALAEMDVDALADLLARAGFVTRLAGAVGA